MTELDDLQKDRSEFNANDVLNFWFYELSASDWFVKNAAVDATIRDRFQLLHDAAAHGELFNWRTSADGRLAEIIVLDQFSRNIYRDDARAFSCDAAALVLAQEAVAANLDQQLTIQQRAFLYMPYMHSESLRIHQQAVRLFSQKGLAESLDYEIQHKAIIERFGRYPHRNKILGRKSTRAERDFLTQPGSSF